MGKERAYFAAALQTEKATATRAGSTTKGMVSRSVQE
jgi:hypothetical protein